MTSSVLLENLQVELGVGRVGHTVAGGTETGAVCSERMFGFEGHF